MGTEQPARGRVLAAALACALALAAPVAASRAAVPLSWTSQASGPTAAGPLSLSCPGEALCIGVDHAGHALLSTDPTAASPAWSSTSIDPGHALTGVSCASEGLCVAVDDAGGALVSTRPASGAWSAPASIDAGHALTSVSCASSALCVAAGEAGSLFVSTDPAAGRWSAIAPTLTANAITGLSCASSTLCVAVDEAGDLLSSTEPGNPARAWSELPAGTALNGVACEPSGVCVAYAADTAFASADPGAPDATYAELGPTWSSTLIDGSHHPLVALSCPASGLCVALDEAGNAFAADDPTSATPHWEASALPHGEGETVAPSALSCLQGGVCVALGAPAAGGLLTSFRGSMPAPEATTTGGHATGATKATVTGTINPRDAVLGACVFQYGTSTSYGHSVPCEAPPASANAAQGVGARIEGLSPGTVYHFRLVATDAAGEGVGGDQTVKTLPPPSLVYPKPTISGKPIAGHWLTCEAHLPAGAQATLSYLWLRGLSPIEGQAQRRYMPTAADAGHHLQCQVTATNEGGSVTRTSPFVAIPIKGVLAAVGETDVVKADLAHTRVEVAVSCSKLATQGCAIEAKLTVLETLRGSRLIAVAAHTRHGRAAHAAQARDRRAADAASPSHRRHGRKRHPPKVRRVTVTIGSANVSIEPNHDRVVKVFLNPEGRKLLHERSEGVQAELTVIGTVVGVLKTRLRREVVSVAAVPHRAKRPARHHS